MDAFWVTERELLDVAAARDRPWVERERLEDPPDARPAPPRLAAVVLREPLPVPVPVLRELLELLPALRELLPEPA